MLLNEGGIFRFSGGIESITDGHTLWVKGEDMTIPVSLDKTKCYLLPVQEGEMPQAPEQIRRNTVCTMTEGTKVFIGGQVKMQNNRLSFCSTKDETLMVIFYNCSDEDLPAGIISGARAQNDYWNNLTPASVISGALALIYMAASLLGRPAFRLTVISAIIAVFIPILPVLPPGLLFTNLYNRLIWKTRKLRAKEDLVYYGLLQEKNTINAHVNVHFMEIFAILILLFGIFLNVVFIFLILFQFEVISF